MDREKWEELSQRKLLLPVIRVPKAVQVTEGIIISYLPMKVALPRKQLIDLGTDVRKERVPKRKQFR